MKRLKEHEGFRPGMTVYLRSDLSARIPMTVKTIQVITPKSESLHDLSELELFSKTDDSDDSQESVEIVCLRATSQKNIVVDFFPPEVLTTDPKKQ
jgi:hypothetical protein